VPADPAEPAVPPVLPPEPPLPLDPVVVEAAPPWPVDVPPVPAPAVPLVLVVPVPVLVVASVVELVDPVDPPVPAAAVEGFVSVLSEPQELAPIEAAITAKTLKNRPGDCFRFKAASGVSVALRAHGRSSGGLVRKVGFCAHRVRRAFEER
jgi:hypothetical protein